MRGLPRTRWIAGAAVLALALAACGGGDDDSSDDEGSDDAAATGGSYSLYIGDPENPLIPGNTNESEGSQVLEPLFTGLIQYNPDTSEAEYTGVAESIESDDNTTWTVTLKDGWTFHDGSPVNSASFIDAWNYTALSTNAQGNSYFMGNIVGFDELQATTDAEGNVTAEPTATEMSGLTEVDDLTFEVELSAPYAAYPVTVGYNAFFPLPPVFFDDPAAFGAQPVGNGPFQADEPFVTGVGITLTKYADYAGTPANADSVEMRVYTELNTGYTDVQAGNLDIIDQIPPDAINSAPGEFGERFIERPRGDITLVWFPNYDPRFEDPQVRQAFSLAIDRAVIVDSIFNGTREPATSFISPVVDGYRDDACELCLPDPERANELLDAAGFDRSQPVDLWFNAGAGHDEWMQAMGNQLRENLGIEYTLRGDLQFAQYLPLVDEKGMTGPFRLGWIMDYPTPENFLGPLYTTEAFAPNGSNGGFYSNPDFDALVQEGNEAPSIEEAISIYQEAEDIILDEMPALPMWYGLIQSVHSENVSNVVLSPQGQIQTALVEVAS